MNKEEKLERAEAIEQLTHHLTMAAIEQLTHHLTTSLGEVVEVLAQISRDIRGINERMP